MSAAVSRLLAAKASLPPSSGVPLGLLLGSYYPEAAASEAGGASKGSVHALQWSPLASLSSDPDFQEGADALVFLQQLQQAHQQQVVDRLIRQASLCCSHHLVGGLAVLGVWARVSVPADQLHQQQQQLQHELQLSRLASAVADGTLEGLNAADEAATAAVLHLYEEGGCSTKGLPKQPFVLVLLQQHNLQDSVAHFSWMSGNSSWSSLSSATLFPSSSLLRQQQQQMLQLCCSPLSLNLTLLLHPSLMRQHSAATILGTGQLRRALRRALRVFAGLEEAPMGYSRESFPFYCCLRKGLSQRSSTHGSGQQLGTLKGAPCAPDTTISTAIAAATAGAASAPGGEDFDALQIELFSSVTPSLCLRIAEDGCVSTVSAFVQQKQQQMLRAGGYTVVRCSLAQGAVSLNPKHQTLKTAMEFLIADWVRGAVGSLNGSLEEAWGEREGPPSALHVSLHQRRYLTTQHAPLLEQQLKAHGAPAVLAELAPAAEGEEGSERVRVEFLFGGEWRWGVIAALRLFSFADISIENPKGSDAHKDLQNTGALQAEHDRYWKALINCVRTEKLKMATSKRPWYIWVLPLLALLLSYFLEWKM
ncbi:uncharacterized protein LOC34621672 [Cyclospora cayetanensis]|uniref:Uncharacterized protein LOC34621672 n=1 Tax=Cyclospora cayetanensis TaxID=88456 RepID=A0A6P6RZ85_9EIME|nr:uncharacterized protein LOC34621672 [Cyclospora cayetanensis]